MLWVLTVRLEAQVRPSQIVGEWLVSRSQMQGFVNRGLVDVRNSRRYRYEQQMAYVSG